MDKTVKIVKQNVKIYRNDNELKLESYHKKPSKIIKSEKFEKLNKFNKIALVDFSEKLSKSAEKIEEIENPKRTEPLKGCKRRKLFHLKVPKKYKDSTPICETVESKTPVPQEFAKDSLSFLKEEKLYKDSKIAAIKSSQNIGIRSPLEDPFTFLKKIHKEAKDSSKNPYRDSKMRPEFRRIQSRQRVLSQKSWSQDSKDDHPKFLNAIKEKESTMRKEKQSKELITGRKVEKSLIEEQAKFFEKESKNEMANEGSKDSTKEVSYGVTRFLKSTSFSNLSKNNSEGLPNNILKPASMGNSMSNNDSKQMIRNSITARSRKDSKGKKYYFDMVVMERERPEMKLKGGADQQMANDQSTAGESIVSLPVMPSNITTSIARKRKITTRHKNDLDRFFDPIKELCVSIPEINEMFNIHQLIGYGAFSTVLLATLKKESKFSFEKRAKFAVKHLSANNSPSRIKREMQFMTKIGGSNNVVKLHCCSRHHESVAFVMPYLECDHFKHYFRLMEPAEVQLYMQNLLVALRHVHKFNVIHRDVKPGNFLYNRVQRKFMLVDFGLAEEVIDLSKEESTCSERENETKKHASRAGTRGFRPPEVLLRFMHQTTAVDIWAVGVIFLSILSKVYPPFKPPNDQWAMKEIIGVFGDKQIVKVAKRLRCPVPATEACKPLDLRKICVHFRNLCKNPAVNRTIDTDSSDYADKKCKNCRQCVYNCLCQTPKGEYNVSIALDCYPSSTYDLLQKLLEVGPHDRVTAEEALQHPFFKERFPRIETSHNNFYMPIRGSLMQILRKN